MKIDMHSHFLPDTVIDLMCRERERLGVSVVKTGDREIITHACGIAYPNFKEVGRQDKRPVGERVLPRRNFL